ncbi:multidrug efflux SMR transporter [Sinomonas atrocyanea]|uniref:DMT family transporter n=1 Tax=Sinomonas atrocyanea TaxID=37927 RepID=UPI00277E1D06|nr:SMR family transporter [Sinomonas atrocyanea]MDQ0259094.1 quaternary ammonium compound-resistance protein SugE [Sinomonas atrocyanea]MDR6622626.1 quaternary ammonium compound-resistance protein SugE [Sinomonas atrocyanea]
MLWLVLILSGALEAVWAAALERSEGFRRPLPALVFVLALAASMGGLALSLTAIPVGTAYAVWVGVGVVLTVVYAMAARVEPQASRRTTAARTVLLLGIAGCVAGLKAVA